MKEAIKDIVGRTITGVIAVKMKHPGEPKYRVYLLFPDEKYFELYSSSDGTIHGAGGIDHGGYEELMVIIKRGQHCVEISRYDTPRKFG